MKTDFVKELLVRLFWFFIGVMAIILVHEDEDKNLMLRGKKPIHHTEDYYREENPDWFE